MNDEDGEKMWWGTNGGDDAVSGGGSGRKRSWVKLWKKKSL